MNCPGRTARALTAWLGLAAVLGTATGPAAAQVAAISDWQQPGADHAMTRFSALAQISTTNVADLRPVWSFETGVVGPHEGNPLVVGNRMFVHTPFPNTVYALDLTKPDSPVVWTYAVPKATGRLRLPSGCCDVGSRGLAFHSRGIVYVPLFHGELAALDAATGREIWRLRNTDFRAGGSMPAAPAVINDLVIVGTGGAEYGVRGYLTAYDAATGRLIWRAYHTGPDADVLIEGDANTLYASHRGRNLGVSSWPAEQWRRGGATASGWISYDPELDLLYYGTDHPGTYNGSLRPGDNKWANTIFARSATTGVVRWALQLTPHDEWGYDASNENMLVDLTIGGSPVKALVHIDRNGFAYTIDRTNGRILLAGRIGPTNWASQIDYPTATPVRAPRFATSSSRVAGICPATAGMKGLNPAAYSPLAGMFFVPLNNLCMSFQATDVTFTPGQPYLGARIRMEPGPGGNRGRFVAWDATTGAIMWQNQEPFAVTSGALATAGGLVFYGTMDGWLKAVDAATGRDLWRHKTPSGIVGSPISYQGPDGKQYIAVLSGSGGWLGSGGNGAFPDTATIARPGGVLTVFGH